MFNKHSHDLGVKNTVPKRTIRSVCSMPKPKPQPMNRGADRFTGNPNNLLSSGRFEPPLPGQPFSHAEENSKNTFQNPAATRGTHYKIFGSGTTDQPGSGRRYRMGSDIFGTGFGQKNANSMGHSSFGPGALLSNQQNGHVMRGAEGDTLTTNADKYQEQIQEMFDGGSVAGRRNARENGGNPLTGEGYQEDLKLFSRRRQFVAVQSVKPW